jgi:hypothetical protein
MILMVSRARISSWLSGASRLARVQLASANSRANRNCLAATPRFGILALPLFLDKMQAASEKAKVSTVLPVSKSFQLTRVRLFQQRQTLQALTACFPIYGAAACGEWAGRFSEALSIEVSLSFSCRMGRFADAGLIGLPRHG